MRKILFAYLLMLACIGISNNRATAQTTTSESFDGTTFPPTGWTRSNSTVLVRSTSCTFPSASTHSGAGMADMVSSSATGGNSYQLVTPSIDWSNRCTGCTPTVSFWLFKDGTWTNAGNNDFTYLEVYVNVTPDLNGAPYLIDRLNTRTDAYPTASAGWNQYSYNIPSAYNSSTNYIVFNFHYATQSDGDDLLLDDVSYTSYPSAPPSMTYTSSTTTQNTSGVSVGTTNQQVIGVQVVAANNCAFPLNLSSLTFNTTGTTSTSDITTARVWYTGTSSTFATTSLYGSAVANPNGTFSITSAQTLSSGTNYFWLTYDISPNAVYTDVVDAQCTSIIVGGNTQTPTVTNPAGSRTISDYTYCAAAATGDADYITAVTINSFAYTNNGQAGSAPYYYQNTSQNVNLTAGSAYSQVYAIHRNSGTDYVNAWIDYNRDGIFSATELIGSGNRTTSGNITPANFTVPACATPGETRLRVLLQSGTNQTNPCATGMSSAEIEDYYVTIVAGGTSMAYSSSTCSQPITTEVAPSSTSQQILQIQVVTTNCSSPLNATSFALNTTGSSLPADITNAKLWYTGTSSTFATTNLFGATTSPSGAYTVTGNQTLSSGTNYFWLTYDIATAATIGDVIDAQCTSITVGGSPYTPTTTSPAGNREIDLLMPTGGVYYACNGKFYDSGGSTATSGLYECRAIILYPSSANSNVTLNFTSANFQTGSDVINIYNGIGTTGAPTQINTFTTFPSSVTGCNNYGALTVEFMTNGGWPSGDDWVATISCTSPTNLTWNGSASTNWATASNWTPAIVPTSCYDVTIPSGTTRACIITNTTVASCKSMTINSGATLTVQSTTGSLNIYGNLTNNGTINFTGTNLATNTTPYIHMWSKGGTISGTGAYTTTPIYFGDQSVYTLSGNASFTNFYIYGTASLTHTSNTVNISTSLVQKGTWSLGSSTVNFSGDDGTASAPNYPDIKSSLFSAGTSTFNYSSISNKQYVTAATYYDLQVNNNSTYIVPVGYYTTSSALTTTCHNFTLIQGTTVTSGYVNLYFPITITGDLYIRSGCVFDANDHASGTASLTTDNSITLAGIWTNSGTFINGNGNNFNAIANPRTVILNGSSLQTISGTTTSTFYNLTLSKSAGNTQLNGIGATVTNQLALGSNIFDLNTQTLTLSNNSTTAITRTSGYVLSEDPLVNAKINWNIANTNGSYVYPFGYSGSYIPFTFQLTAGNAGYVSLATYHTAANNQPYPPGVTHTNDTTGTSTDNSANTVDRFWQINKAGASGTANISFTYTSTEAPASGNDSLRAQRWSGIGWQSWYTNGTQNANAATNRVTASNVSTFSPWTLARKMHPLPIELLDFTASSINKAVELNWKTASEINNALFTVERSQDGTSFETIGNLKGHGNSSTTNNYTIVDNSPYMGLSYYRLKQTDFNGNSTYSVLKTVTFIGKSEVKISPNPVNTDIAILTLSTSADDEATVRIYNEMGSLVYASPTQPVQKGVNDIKLPVGHFKPGLYHIKVTMNNEEQNTRLIKQ